jgi:hypothetical protein
MDFDGAADIADAIEQAGGRVRDFDVGQAAPQPQGIIDLTALMKSSVTVYHFAVEVPSDTTRDIDIDQQDPVEREAIVSFLASMLEAGDGMPVDPDMTPAQNLRAVVGQTDYDLSMFREAYDRVHDDLPTGWDAGPPPEPDAEADDA